MNPAFLIAIIIFMVLIILYLLAIMPNLKHNPKSNKLDGWLYAHRGLHDNKGIAPENSLKAFHLAVEQGYGIELDVQLTKDMVPIIFHDRNLQRACGVAYKVTELTYEEISKYALFYSKEKIPTLKQVLKVVNSKVPIIIELKAPLITTKLCKVVADTLMDYKGVYCIQSFNTLALIWYKKHLPGVVRGQLSTDFLREKITGNLLQHLLIKYLLLNFLAKPDFIAYHHVYKDSLSFTLCRKLYKVKSVAWTIQTQEQYDKSGKYYDLFIFDSFIPAKSTEGTNDL